MSQIDRHTRIASLIAAAGEQAQQGHLQNALQQLREASHLDADNDDVKAALSQLQIVSTDDDTIGRLDSYVASGSDDDLQSLLQSFAKKDTLNQADAGRCFDTILQHDYTQGPWANVLCRLVNGQAEARKVIAQQISTGSGYMFDLLLHTSDGASKALFQVLFDASAWALASSQIAAQKDIYRKCILQHSGSLEYHRSTELMLRQLMLSPKAVADISDEQVFKRLFALLDIRKPQVLRGQALLATSKLFQALEEKAETVFAQLISQYAASTSTSQHIIAFSATAVLFPVIPAICARLLLTEGFLQTLVPLLQVPRISEVDNKYVHHQGEVTSPLTTSSDTTLAQRAVLELLSAACIDKACREAILKHCQAKLKALSKDGSANVSALSALTLAKASGHDTEPGVVDSFREMLVKDSIDSSLAIEGLAYASLKPAVKEQISKDDKLIKRLITTISQPEHSLSCLTILSNLTAYRPAQSGEQKKMIQLKAYANSSKPAPEDSLDNNNMVSNRCKKLLDASLVSALVACMKDLKTVTSLGLVARIINSVAREPKHRTKIVQEGGIRLLLQINGRLDALKDKDSLATQRIAAHGLARMLISMNPTLVFTSALPATSAVSAMLPLLEVDQAQEERDLLPTFEALLALTNLASMNDISVCDLIMRNGWSMLEDQHLLSNNMLIQRASTELVCNLMQSPSGVAKFADGSDQAGRRLHILLGLADVEDLATRRASGGALAMLTEWDTAVMAIAKIPRGTKILLSMCADKHDDMKHRGMICALNCVGIPGKVGSDSIERIKAQGGVAIVRQALKSTKSTDVLAAGADLLKKLM